MIHDSDEALMQSYGLGSRAAFEELFRRHERRAWAFFRHRVASEDRAWDLYQELFLHLHRFRATYDPGQPFLPWFYQIARNVLIDDLRRAYHARELPMEASVAVRASDDVERTVAAREAAFRELAQLTEESARVVVAAKVLEEEYAEIAREIGKSRDAVKQIASRALRRLRVARSTGT